MFYLELRQYKNGFVSVKRMFVLKLPVFFPCRAGEAKRAEFQNKHAFTETSPFLYFLSSRLLYTVSQEQLFLFKSTLRAQKLTDSQKKSLDDH